MGRASDRFFPSKTDLIHGFFPEARPPGLFYEGRKRFRHENCISDWRKRAKSGTGRIHDTTQTGIRGASEDSPAGTFLSHGGIMRLLIAILVLLILIFTLF